MRHHPLLPLLLLPGVLLRLLPALHLVHWRRVLLPLWRPVRGVPGRERDVIIMFLSRVENNPACVKYYEPLAYISIMYSRTYIYRFGYTICDAGQV